MGELHTVSGTGTYPVSYTYDPQGRQRTMTTATGITTWAYHPQRGWLASKTDAANKAVAYTYTPGGLLHTRTWERGVSTTYGYDVAGELDSVSYSDGTPGHTLERDLRGRVTEVSDGTGTRTFAHTTEGLLESESFISGLFAGMETVYNYDSLLRRDELLLKQGATTLALTSYGYDAASRLEEVMGGDLEVVYSRLANSSLLDDTTYEMNSTPAMTVSRSYDALNRLTGIGATPGVGPARSVGYQFDAAGRRERATREDDRYWQFGYNTRNEVTSGVKHWSDDSVVPGMSYGYAFDGIGNRTQTEVNGRVATYTPNDVNQYISRTVPGAVDILGWADTQAAVTVNGQAPSRVGGYFYQMLVAANELSPLYLPVTVDATLNNETSTVSGSRFVAETPETFAYDDDGNLLEDGRWLYAWDGENRLIRMETRPAAVAAGAPAQRLSFAYDYMGRRISKEVEVWREGRWRTLHKRFFHYDGWNLIAEVLDDGRLIRSYTWGLDLSGSMQGAGGVGGLLAIHDHLEQKTFFPAYDGNGNIIALVNAQSGTTVATYEYSPFGQLIAHEGTYALVNPFRFSTKYTDNETGLLYYGYRYYDPETGRWPNRDPIGERGGPNLYGFVGNDGVNRWDLLGLRAGYGTVILETIQNFKPPSGKTEAIDYMIQRIHRYFLNDTNNYNQEFLPSNLRNIIPHFRNQSSWESYRTVAMDFINDELSYSEKNNHHIRNQFLEYLFGREIGGLLVEVVGFEGKEPFYVVAYVVGRFNEVPLKSRPYEELHKKYPKECVKPVADAHVHPLYSGPSGPDIRNRIPGVDHFIIQPWGERTPY